MSHLPYCIPPCCEYFIYYSQLLSPLISRCVSFFRPLLFSDTAPSLSKWALAWHMVLCITKCRGEVKEGIYKDWNWFPHYFIISHWDALIAVKQALILSPQKMKWFCKQWGKFFFRLKFKCVQKVMREYYQPRQYVRSPWIQCVCMHV